VALTAFEEIRARRGRSAVVGGIALWLAAIASSIFVGIATGLVTLLVVGFPLQELGEAVGADPDIDATFSIGSLFTFLVALVGFPVAILASDRLGAWAMGADPPDPDLPADRRIDETVRTVALAAGVDPLVLVVHEPWIDGAALGRRGSKEVVMLSSGTALLDDDHLELLAAAVLADSIVGKGASRARAGASAPGIIPFLLCKRALRWVRRRPRFALGGLIAWVALWTLTLALSADDPGNDVLETDPVFAAMAVLVFSAFVAFLSGILVGIYLIWSAFLAVLAMPIAARARQVADVGMAGLVRAPEQWVEFLITAGSRGHHPPSWSGKLIGWVLPRDPGAAQRRVAHLAEHVPGGRAALGHLLEAPTTEAPR
jgi:hypothetical protein